MSQEIVEIKYINRSLAQKLGAGPIKVNLAVAKSLQSKGFCLILNKPAQSNLTLSQKELDEIKERYEEDAVAYVQEEKHLTKISWLFSDFVDLNIRKIGTQCGFKITPINSINFTPGKLLLSDLIIVSSNLTGFSDLQLVQLKSCLFQKQVPYLYRIDSKTDFKNETVLQFIMNAKKISFVHEVLFDECLEALGELIGNDWMIESGNHYEFWRELNNLVE